MVRKSVISSNLKSVGYDSFQMVLEIEFLEGSVYQYYGVPQSVYANLMSAPSYGMYFHADIRNNYRYSQVG